MRTTRFCAALIFSLALLGSSIPLSARMNPQILMIYGGALVKPVFVVIRNRADVVATTNLWCGSSGRVIPKQLADRPHFDVAIFWGVRLEDAQLPTLKPEQAHQHGRLYVASRDVPAAAVTTAFITADPTGTLPLAQPIPRDVTAFKYGAWLGEADIQFVEKLGVSLRNRQLDPIATAR